MKHPRETPNHIIEESSPKDRMFIKLILLSTEKRSFFSEPTSSVSLAIVFPTSHYNLNYVISLKKRSSSWIGGADMNAPPAYPRKAQVHFD